MRTLRTMLLVLVIACSSRGGDNDAELAKRASQTMAELTTADESLPKQITEALTGLSASLLVGKPGKAAERIEGEILPLLDRYVATIERAVAAADAYMANKDDAETKQAIEQIRKRGDAFRKARARFVEVAQQARGGASVEELSASLVGIGTMLNFGM